MRYLLVIALLASITDCPPKPVPSPSPTPTVPPTTTTTLPGPNPTPTPTPTTPPSGSVIWLPTGNNDPVCPRIGEDSLLRPALEVAIKKAGIWPDPNSTTPLNEEQIFNIVVDYLPYPIEACIYGTEEIALAKPGQGFSDVFDIKQFNGKQRSGSGSYRSRCSPARCTKRLIPNGPVPTPSPSPTPEPPFTICTFSHDEFVQSGRFQGFKIVKGPGDRFNVDVTPQVCNRDKCTAAGFVNRDCCPSFPEGNPFGPKCDVEMSLPQWTTPNTYCNVGGPNGLNDNPLRNCLRGTGSIKVCSAGSTICAEGHTP